MGLTDIKARLGIDELKTLNRLQRSFTNRNKLDIIKELHRSGKMSDDEYEEKLKKILENEGGLA